MRAVALLLLLTSTACTNYHHPAADQDSLSQLRRETPGPTGYLGMTAGFDLASFREQPSVVFTLKRLEDGDTVELKVSEMDLEALGRNKEYVPLLFVLPAGRYEMTSSMMNVPGGLINGREYVASHQLLGVEKRVQPFTVEPDAMTHIVVAQFKLTQSLSQTTLYYQTLTDARLEKPAKSVWAPYQALLATTPAVYSKQTQVNTYTWPKLAWTDGKDGDDTTTTVKTGSGTDTQKTMRSSAQIQRVTNARKADVNACALRHAPKSKGKLEVKYIIAPDGKVHEANVVDSTLKNENAEQCIIDVFKRLKFSKSSEDDFETWTSTWEF